MAETLISPGVFLNENDQSQITQGPLAAGAAILGPTVIGPVNIPTVVTSYSQYKSIFGSTFVSGGLTTEYLTSVAALNYFNQGGNSLLVTRVASGSYTSATASVASTGYTNITGTFATASYTPVSSDTASWGMIVIDYPTPAGTVSYQVYNTPWTVTGSYFESGNGVYIGVGTGGYPYVNVVSSIATWAGYVVNAVNANTSDFGKNISASFAGGKLTFTTKATGTAGNNFVLTSSWNNVFASPVSVQFVGGTNSVNAASFELETLSVGTVMNNATGSATNGALPSGSNINVRWEVVASDSGSGTFTINIRRGDDYNNSKTILESWANLSLDPNQNNFISYVIGDQKDTVATDGTTYYIQPQGNYPNKSKYVRVKSVNLPTPNYFNSNGIPQPQFTGSLPLVGSGSLNGGFAGAVGAIWGSFGSGINLFENIPNVAANSTANNVQGLLASNYDTAIALLSNKDAYDFNVVYAPGLTSVNAPSQISSLIQLSQDRGDNISVIDMVGYGQSLTTVTSQAVAYDNSYAATYWPWIQIRSAETGRLNFVPPSTIVPAIYEYNDKVAAEWWAPAGINRGGMTTVLQPERKLTINDRNTLYASKVNPIANFAGVGTVIYGQKTLQSTASALDRVNVRRLLIALKRYIGQIGETLVFEPNTQVTRNKFLNQVNPYLETVQQKQGLYSFQVVMDETNNTPDTIDRNILVGSIYLQPTRVAEFIQLDFNILPTGTSFGQ